MAQIHLERLTKKFPGTVAVDDLTMTIGDGEFFALLGPSGCGKTTTMNMIAGLETPTAGEIYFDEVPVSHLPPKKRSVGFVFQNFATFTHMTVFENLAFGLRVRRPAPSAPEIEAAVQSIAGTVGVTALLSTRAGRLSVNDMQRVALGRSMIVQPAILLLDEPLSNLDAAFRAYMRAELKRIQVRRGQTTVYVTHDQVEAMSLADRIAVMERGVLQQVGTPLEIYNRPANTFVAGFVGSPRINFFPAGTSLPRPHVQEGRRLRAAIRPEYATVVAAESETATIRGRVSLVEPLGAKDVVHVMWEGRDVCAIGAPGARPRVGENVGLAFAGERLLFFDETTGEAVNGAHPA